MGETYGPACRDVTKSEIISDSYNSSTVRPTGQATNDKKEADIGDKIRSNKALGPILSSEKARRLVSIEIAMRYQFLPMSVLTSRSGRQLTIAGDVEALNKLLPEIEFAIRERVRVIPYGGTDLTTDIERAYHSSELRLISAAGRASIEHNSNIERRPKNFYNLKEPNLRDNSESGVAEFVASLVEFAIARGASDMHLTPTKEGVNLGLRVGRQMHYLTESLCDRAVFERVVARLKVLSGANPTIKFVPLDGSFSASFASGVVGIRFSSLPTVFGERIVLRISKKASTDRLDSLGLDYATLSVIDEVILRGSGLSLICGPTGSGKTTSLYGMIRKLIDAGKVVISIEDPVERWIEGVSQININETTGLTFGVATKAALRQGPDVLVIGEIRDQESAKTAIRMSMCGHLVLTTIHARCVFEALERYASLLGSSVGELQGITAVIAQRLIESNCCDDSLEFSLKMATQTLVMTPGLGRLLKSEKITRCDFYKGVQNDAFLPFEQYARRWLEEGVINMEQYRALVSLDH